MHKKCREEIEWLREQLAEERAINKDLQDRILAASERPTLAAPITHDGGSVHYMDDSRMKELQDDA